MEICTPKKFFLSIIFSFKNEADVIPELISRVRKATVQAREMLRGYELIFVNDASTDASRELLNKLGKENNDIIIINMSRTFGVAPCVIAGFEKARGDILIYLDCDLQDPPEIIPQLIQKAQQGYDIVHTVRLSRKGESRIKLAITRLGYKILRAMSSINLVSNAGDFKLLTRKAADAVLRCKETKPFIRGLVTWVGFSQEYIYFHREPRAGGQTKFPIFSSGVINNFLNSALISFSDVPIKLFFLFGICISFLSFLYLPYVLIKHLLGYSIPINFLFIAAFFFYQELFLLVSE